MDARSELLANLHKLHTTPSGALRIKNNLAPDTDDVVGWCREKIAAPDTQVSRKGKNWYAAAPGCVITVNAGSYTIITAHKAKSRMKKLLFSRESACIQPIRELVEEQNHRTLVLWALDCAPRFLEIFEASYPCEKRPRELIGIAAAWARGEIKMPLAKKAILAAHAAAAAAGEHPAAQAAARAVAHAAATIHVETHALGVVFYGLTALVYSAGPQNAEAVADQACRWFYERLLYWQANAEQTERKWAPFLLRDDVPNKEKLLRLKQCKAMRGPEPP